MRNSLEGSLQLQLPGTLIFDYPTISALQHFLGTQAAEQKQQQQQQVQLKGRGERVQHLKRTVPKSLPVVAKGAATLQVRVECKEVEVLLS